MGSTTIEYKLMMLLFVFGSSVNILEVFEKLRMSSFVFHEVPSALNEPDIYSDTEVKTCVGALS